MNIFWIILVVVIFVLYFWYAGIVTKKNKVKESLASIDVQLKKRSDLLPNILAIAKKFMEHEKSLLSKITELRTSVDSGYNSGDAENVKQHLQKTAELDQSLGKLMIAVEAYPDLKSDETMLQAQRTYNEVEEHIAAARRFYNSSVAELNNSIEIFPGNMLAGLAGAVQMPFYETDEASKAPVDANKFLN
jgi:LemA protein